MSNTTTTVVIVAEPNTLIHEATATTEVNDATEVMLTTFDNPFDPFTQFNAWYSFDLSAGYHTTALLARILVTSDELSEADQDLAYNLAVAEIIKENVSGMHRTVTKR